MKWGQARISYLSGVRLTDGEKSGILTCVKEAACAIRAARGLPSAEKPGRVERSGTLLSDAAKYAFAM